MFYLYFEDKYEKRIAIAACTSRKPLIKEMYAYLEQHHYEAPPYLRAWKDRDGVEWLDFGSHSEFFLISELPLK